ncbi:MAG: hypothetical protein ACI4U1_06830 [Anaerovoracaceae bacterium]
MKKKTDRKEMTFLLRNLKDGGSLFIEFNEHPKRKGREIDSKELHMALGTMEMGERLLVRFNGSNE